MNDSSNRHSIRLVQVLEATIGGTRRHVNDLLFGLDQDRFDLHAVVSLNREPEYRDDIERLKARGVSVHEIEMLRSITPLSDLRAARRMTALFRGLRPDIVHAHGSKGGVIGRRAAAAAGVAGIVHTAHVYPFQWAPPSSRLAGSAQ